MIGTEPLIAIAAGALGNLISETFSETSRNLIAEIFMRLLRFLGANVSQDTQQAIFDASKKYIQNYAERHGVLKVLGMREPMGLEAIYTEVQFLDDEEFSTFASIEDLEAAFRSTPERGFRSPSRRNLKGVQILNEKQYLMVLGAPGAGKTTFLRKIGLEALKGRKGKIKHRYIPVLIELKRLSEDKLDIQKIIANEFQICGLPNASRFTQKALEQGKLLILLDGLDEVPTNFLNKAIEMIQDFVDQYDQNSYVVSCRAAAYHYSFRRFTDVIIADFSDTQIQQFISNWFRSDEDLRMGTAQKCWELLCRVENAAAKELAYTPLLLTFLCLVYDRSQSFPSHRSTLYRKALRILLEEWAAEKRILREEIYQGLNTELEEVLLSEIAHRGFIADRLFLYQSEIIDQIKSFLANNLNAPQYLSGEAVLNAIAVQQGILVERAEEIYSFSHLTLQEYLTAQYIYEHRQVQQLVTEYLTDRRWHEVFLLVSGLMRAGRGADELLLEINRAAQTFTSTLKLRQLLDWAEQITNSPTATLKPMVRRTIAIFFFLALARNRATSLALSIISTSTQTNTTDFFFDPSRDREIASEMILELARDFNLARDLTFALNLIVILDCSRNLDRGRIFDLINNLDIANTFDYEQNPSKIEIFKGVDLADLARQLVVLQKNIPDVDQPQEVYQQFSENLWNVCLEAFQLKRELLEISKEEATKIEQYLYVIYLMMRCKQSAVRVSLQTWEEIEAYMFLPKAA